jgi:hypothetical protein
MKGGERCRSKNFDLRLQVSSVEYLNYQTSSTLALLTLLYGNEIWTMRVRDRIRITATEMSLFRQMMKYVWMDYKRNEVMKKTENRTYTGQHFET